MTNNDNDVHRILYKKFKSDLWDEVILEKYNADFTSDKANYFHDNLWIPVYSGIQQDVCNVMWNELKSKLLKDEF